MTPYMFGQKVAAEFGIQPVPKAIPDIPKAPKATTGVTPTGPKPINSGKPGNPFWRAGGNMLSNSGRVGGGMLSAVAGGLGTVGTGVAAGATNAWNAVTPNSMNTSPGFSGAVNNAFNKSVDLTNAGARDVYGGLGGDTNYGQQKSWDVMQQGLNDKTVDPVSRGVATGAAYAGHGAWNLAQAVPAATAALPAAQGAMQFGRQLATTGKNLATTGYNMATAPARFVQNTFKPGFGTLRDSLRDTSRMYSQQPGSIIPYRSPTRTRAWTATPDMPLGRVPPPAAMRNGVRSMSGDARLADTARSSAGGMYFSDRNVATSMYPRGTAQGREIMRHELAHGIQANTAQPNSLQGWVQSMGQSKNPWSQAGANLLAEVNSNAAQAKTIPQQISNGWKFLTDPNMAQFYSNYYRGTSFGPQYAMLHNGAVLAPTAAKHTAAAGAAGAGGAYGANAVSDFMQPAQ